MVWLPDQPQCPARHSGAACTRVRRAL